MNENELLLKFEMLKFGDTTTSLAEYLGIARQTCFNKIKEGKFTQDEMTKIKIRYNLNNEQFTKIFTKEFILNESNRSSETVK